MVSSLESTPVLAAVIAIGCVCSQRTYQLPDGAELLVGEVRSTFQCPEKYGYYADVDNDCRVFHVCNPVTLADGKADIQQYSFICGNQTMFDQLSLTCAFEEESVPCQDAPDFFQVNGNMGIQDVPFLSDNDVEKAAPLVRGFGARNAKA
ncbi:cuticular protein-like [Tropilaelaps mercedesae]|uniref:Cuticular protein-like n=1 Tax=Tropilaelaps mercedesae TaxID=418985 RepID=A0A1V9XLA9_9ACAR|nr:cuticular protein-like [Tropilaelaps mercedesae]